MPFYQWPPGGGAATAIPAGGITYQWGKRQGASKIGRAGNLTIVSTSGTATFQYWDDKDTPSTLITIPSGQGYHAVNRWIQRFVIGGTGTIAAEFNEPPADIDIQSLLAIATTATITGTVTTNVANTVLTDVGQQVGGSIDPRQIRALTTSDQVTPKGGDLTSGALSTSQLPASLDTGSLKVAVEKPLTGAGSVQVHDAGS